MISAVILDVDGTLMDTNYLHVAAWAAVFERLGKIVPQASIHKQIGKSAARVISEFIDEVELKKRANRLHARLYARLKKLARPLPGAGPLIRALDDAGVAVWLATSARADELDLYLRALDVEGKIAGFTASEDIEDGKPAPDIFAAALAGIDRPREDVLTIGDTVWDIQAARSSRLRAAAVLTGGAFSRRELEDAGAVAVYRDCRELLLSGFPERKTLEPGRV